uniref:Uncharacterized protein n=1 Tax=Micrurus surinamensis TaxID=129470 RepID=A0A2D4PHI5_MICSU
MEVVLTILLHKGREAAACPPQPPPAWGGGEARAGPAAATDNQRPPSTHPAQEPEAAPAWSSSRHWESVAEDETGWRRSEHEAQWPLRQGQVAHARPSCAQDTPPHGPFCPTSPRPCTAPESEGQAMAPSIGETSARPSATPGQMAWAAAGLFLGRPLPVSSLLTLRSACGSALCRPSSRYSAGMGVLQFPW